ncbi:hypothetical protein BJX70DRAFT_158931 [Aspergillus crustosus]
MYLGACYEDVSYVPFVALITNVKVKLKASCCQPVDSPVGEYGKMQNSGTCRLSPIGPTSVPAPNSNLNFNAGLPSFCALVATLFGAHLSYFSTCHQSRNYFLLVD